MRLLVAALALLLCSQALAADDPTAKLSGVTDLSEWVLSGQIDSQCD